MECTAGSMTTINSNEERDPRGQLVLEINRGSFLSESSSKKEEAKSERSKRNELNPRERYGEFSMSARGVIFRTLEENKK